MRATNLCAVLVLAGCTSSTRTCKDKTVFLHITYSGAAAEADSVIIDATVDGMGNKTTRLPHHGGATEGTVEVQFPNGYPAGHGLAIAVTALSRDTVVGSGAGS